MARVIVYFMCLFSVPVFISNVRCENEQNFLDAGLELWHFPWSNNDNNLKASLNEYLDQILSRINSQIDYPILIPDYNVSIDTEILVVPITGTLKFYNGEVDRVGTVSRSGDALIIYNNEVLTVYVALDVKNVKFSGDFIAKFESIGPSGSVSGVIEDLTVQAALKFNVNEIHVIITEFNLSAGSIDLSVDIIPILDWFMNSMIKLLVYIIKWPLMGMISSDIKVQAQLFLDSYTDMFQ